MEITKEYLLERAKRTPTGCLEWTQRCMKPYGRSVARGYGIISVWENGKVRNISIHRKSFELFNGPIPDGLCVLHRCDNPPCFEPSHLFLGTRQENNADMFQKGRNRHGNFYGNMPSRKGQKAYHRILKETEVKKIFELRKSGISALGISYFYNVSKSAIYKILQRRRWDCIKGVRKITGGKRTHAKTPKEHRKEKEH